jgi:hypothetical protein
MENRKAEKMNLQVKAILKGGHCYINFSHSFTTMREARLYTKTLKDSVKDSDTSDCDNFYKTWEK